MSEATVDVSLLESIPLFQEISPQSLQRLALLCQEEPFQQGEIIFKEGQRGDKFFIIVEGAIQLTKEIEGIGEEQLAVLREGAYFGEMALIDEAPRSADARATDPSRLVVIRKSDLEEMMFRDPQFAQEILWTFVRTLSTRLRETNEKLRAVYQMNLF